MIPVILIVDDYPVLCAMFSRLIGRLGYRVLTAASTADMQCLLQQHHPALILLDYHLGSEPPGAALAALRQQPDTATIPLVVMTGDFQVERSLQAAGVPTLLKPVMTATLGALLLRMVGPALPPAPAVPRGRAA